MKPLFIAFTLLASLFTTTSFAKDDEKVATAVLQSFQNQFSQAKEATWMLSDNFYKVQFSLNGQYATAFYSSNGTMIALTRNITAPQLPVTLQAEFKKDYENYWVADLFEVTANGTVEYYITLESADTKVVLKSEGVASWTTFQKIRKS
jgi:hypothetical protein